MAHPYFSESPAMQRRQVLLWSVAARRQLDRWEPLVARNLWSTYPDGDPVPDGLIWQAETEHHFAVVAIDHMLEALKLWPSPVPVSAVLRQEIAEVRDLLTHWPENMPIFRSRPRTAEPAKKTGKRFADRNPTGSPYIWLNWTNQRGALLTQSVSATEARAAIAAAQEAVLRQDSELRRFIPPEEPSPWWVDDNGHFWPLQVKGRVQP